MVHGNRLDPEAGDGHRLSERHRPIGQHGVPRCRDLREIRPDDVVHQVFPDRVEDLGDGPDDHGFPHPADEVVRQEQERFDVIEVSMADQDVRYFALRAGAERRGDRPCVEHHDVIHEQTGRHMASRLGTRTAQYPDLHPSPFIADAIIIACPRQAACPASTPCLSSFAKAAVFPISSGELPYSSITLTSALPTMTPSAPHRAIWAAWSGVEIPNPTATGLSVWALIFLSDSSTELWTPALAPVPPVRVT